MLSWSTTLIFSEIQISVAILLVKWVGGTRCWPWNLAVRRWIRYRLSYPSSNLRLRYNTDILMCPLCNRCCGSYMVHRRSNLGISNYLQTIRYIVDINKTIYIFQIIFSKQGSGKVTVRVCSSDKMILIYFLRLSKVYSILYHGSVGRVHKKMWLCFHILFLAFFCCFSS